MRGAPARRLAWLATTVIVTLFACAPALAGTRQSRIVNGQQASPNEYPAQGLLIDSGFRSCGGTLLSPRKYLTAAHCVVNGDNQEVPPAQLQVFLGDHDLDPPNDPPGDVFDVTAVEAHDGYASATERFDVAMLTLSRDAPQQPMRLIRTSEISAWEPDDEATIIGWGDTSFQGSSSDELLEATAPVRSDADCAAAYPVLFDAATMLCVGAADPDNFSSDACQGDSGGPLLVLDGAAQFALAGVVSTGFKCNEEGFPGIYARVGAPGLNSWVRGQKAGLEISRSAGSPRAGDRVDFTATAADAAGFTWDLDADGDFDDATGSSASRTFATAGGFRIAVRAIDSEGQAAERDTTVSVAPGPVSTPTPTPTSTTTPPTSPPVVTQPRPIVPVRLATILALGNPKVRRGRFKMRINFARNAPAGNAFVEVFRGKKKIGSVRARVRRGGSRQVSVKLTKAGRKLLRNSERKRLRVKVQVRVKRLVLGSKTLTIRL